MTLSDGEPAEMAERQRVSPAARPELHGLDLPKDGLSRQWLEFLNQLGAAK